MASGKFVSYLRVSTKRQGQSGLGLEAQREAVLSFLNGGDWELISEFVETESGKRDDRPKLQEALHLCRMTGATLVIAKLDRLSRDAAFLMQLQKNGTRFVAADMPDANQMTVGIMALVAQHEREMISQRTKAALAAAKARGTKLGNPKGAKHLRGRGNAEAVAAVREKADRRAEDLRGLLVSLQENGLSLRQVAEELNRRSILTPRGGAWYAASVKRVISRISS